MRSDEAQQDLEERERFWEERLNDWDALHGHENLIWWMELDKAMQNGFMPTREKT